MKYLIYGLLFMALLSAQSHAYSYQSYSTSAEAYRAVTSKTNQLKHLELQSIDIKKNRRHYANLVQRMRNIGPETSKLSKQVSDLKETDFDPKSYQEQHSKENIRWKNQRTRLNNTLNRKRSSPPTFPNHQNKLNALNSDINELEQLERDGLAELKAGYYCSQCKRPKSKIIKETGQTFEQHLSDVNGVRVPANQSMLDNFLRDSARKIKRVKSKISALEKKKQKKIDKHQSDIAKAERELTQAQNKHDKALASINRKEAKAEKLFNNKRDSAIAKLELEIKKTWKTYNTALNQAREKDREFFNKDLNLDYKISSLRSDLMSVQFAAKNLVYKEKQAHDKKIKQLKRKARLAERKMRKSQLAKKRRERNRYKHVYSYSPSSRINNTVSNKNTVNNQDNLAQQAASLAKIKREQERHEALQQAQLIAQLKRDRQADIESFAQSEAKRTAQLRENDALVNQSQWSDINEEIEDYESDTSYLHTRAKEKLIQTRKSRILANVKTLLKEKTEAIVNRVKYNLQRRGEQMKNLFQQGKVQLKDDLSAAPETFIESFLKETNSGNSFSHRISHGVSAVTTKISDSLNLKKRFNLNAIKKSTISYLKNKVRERLFKADYEAHNNRQWEDLSGTEQTSHSLMTDVKSGAFISPGWSGRLKEHMTNMYDAFAKDFSVNSKNDGLIIDD